MPRPRSVGVGFRDLQLDLERATGRPASSAARWPATTLRSATDRVPMTPSTGARTVSSSTRRCAVPATSRCRCSWLTARLAAARSTSSLSSVAAWAACLLRISADFSASSRLLVVVLGDDADDAPPPRCARRCAGPADALDLGRVGFALGEQLLLAREDLLARDLGLQLLVGRLLALRARRRRSGDSSTASTSPVLTVSPACTFRLTVAGGGRVQRRADGGDHAAVDRGVAHQRAAADLGDAQARWR